LKILLMGHPNVGKSVVFNRLTGANATESNYPGTTVDYEKGYVFIEGHETEVLDVPGTFSLYPKDKAEEVALKIFTQEKDAVIICVLDATKIERGLYLVLEVLERSRSVIIALNMWDVAKDKGISIDHDHLSSLLGVPVVPTVAVSGAGMKELIFSIHEACTSDVKSIVERAMV